VPGQDRDAVGELSYGGLPEGTIKADLFAARAKLKTAL
jgi:hypothetical protein